MGSRKIQLADLNRYIFTDQYAPAVGPNGQPELVFREARGESGLEEHPCGPC